MIFCPSWAKVLRITLQFFFFIVAVLCQAVRSYKGRVEACVFCFASSGPATSKAEAEAAWTAYEETFAAEEAPTTFEDKPEANLDVTFRDVFT